MADQFTAKLSVDVSDLKKNINDATKTIKRANAEFKAQTSGMDSWSKNADGLTKKLESLDKTLGAQKTILEAYKKQLQSQKDAYAENGKRAEELKAKLQELADKGVAKSSEEYQGYVKELQKVTTEQQAQERVIEDLNTKVLEQEAAVGTTERAISHYSGALEDLKDEQKKAADEAKKQASAYGQLEKTIATQESDLEDLKQKYKQVVVEKGKDSAESKALADEIKKLSKQLSDNKDKMADAEKAADDLDDTLEEVGDEAKETGDGFTILGGTLANLAASAIKSVIGKLKDLAKEAYAAWEAVDEGRDTITALTGATGELADSLQASFGNVAKQIVAPFDQIGTTIGELNTRFGITGTELEDLSVKILQFAQLNGTDAKTAIDSLQSAMAAWNVPMSEAGSLLDTLNKVGQDTGESVDAITQALMTNAPALQEMGIGISDAAFFLGNLNKNGVDSSSVLAGLKKALQNATKQGKPMSDALAEIQDTLKNATTDQEAMTAATELFGAKAGPAIATAVRDGRLSFEDFGTYLGEFDGNISSTFENMQDAPDKVALKMQELKLAAADVLDKFLDEYGPDIEALLTKITDELLPAAVDGFGSFIDALKNVGQYAGVAKGVIAGLITTTATFLAFRTAMKVMEEGWMALTIVQKGAAIAQAALNAVQAASPMGLLIMLIGGVVAAIITLWNNSEEFRDAWEEIWDKITGVAKDAWEGIKRIWETVKRWFDENVVAPIKYLFQDGFDGIGKRAGELWDNMKKKFREGWDDFKSGAKEAWDNVKKKFSDGWENLKSGAADAWKKVKEKFAGWSDFWDDLWEKVKKKFSSLGESIGSAISTAVKSGINKVIKLIEDKINSAIGIINGAIDLINMIPGVRASKIQKVSLPRLATGGVLKRGQVGLLEGSGAEAVVPLERNKQWIRSVARDMLGALQREAAAGGATTNSAVANNTTYNYTQNIYSPEAPSRLDIYRQTQNLLALTGGR